MKKINIPIFIFALLLSSVSLFAQKFVTSIAPQDVTYLTIEDKDMAKNFLAAQSNQKIQVTTNLALHVKSSETWCMASVTGAKEVTITASANTGENVRTADVVIYGKDNKSATVKVTQLGTKEAILVNEKSIYTDQYTSTFSLGITSSIVFSFDLPDWINVPEKAPATGFNTYEFTLTSINENETREGEIVIKTTNGAIAEIKIPVKQIHVGYPSFAVISDIHFGNSQGEGPMVKVPKALKNLTSHKKLDALFIVGDLTDGGTASQYTQLVQVFNNQSNFTQKVDTVIFMMGNHDNYDSNGQQNYINGLKPLNNNRAYPLDQYIVIKGYPFISISQRNSSNTDATTESNGTGAYPQAVQDTLRSWMAKAARECPGKPIFVFTHVPLKYTCYSSWPGEGDGTSWPTWSMKVLNPILNQYPQAVVFGGHSHFPIGDPRSIHQGVNPNSDKKNFYTGINTGSTTYSEVHRPSVDVGIHPEQYAYVTEGMILTAQGNGNVEIRRYDTYRNEEMHPENPWVLKAPHDGSRFEYADIRDKDDNNVKGLPLRNGLPAPVFAPAANITLGEPTTNAVKITFPQATDNDYVFRYRVRVRNSANATVKEYFLFSRFYLNSAMPATLSVDATGLTPNTTYTVEVVACDSYENISDPLVSQSFTTLSNSAPGAQVPARKGSWLFDDDSDLLKATIGQDLIPCTTANGTGSGGGVSVKATPAEANITSIAGPSATNKAITIQPFRFLKLNHGITSTVSSYTIMYDVRINNNTVYHPLLQTDLANKNDADFFINKSAQIGLNVAGWGYGGNITTNTWHRIVFVVTDGKSEAYLNGSSVRAAASAANDRWRLDPLATLLFADEDDETGGSIDVAEVAFWDSALTPDQVANLGNIE